MSEPKVHLQTAPGKTPFDYGVAVAKVGALAFPFLGAGITLFDLVTAPARDKRMTDWCEELRLRLNELGDKVAGLTPEALATNEAFISAFAQATTAAIKTHQKEKLEALRNAVLNVAVGTAPEDHYQSFFLNLVDSLTASHLLMLKQFSLQKTVSIVSAPDWLKSNVASQLANDLFDRGLLATPNHLPSPGPRYPIIGKDGVYTLNGELTHLGRDFLSFITDPAVKT